MKKENHTSFSTKNVNRTAIEQLLDYLTNAHMPFAQTMRFKWDKSMMMVNYQLSYGHNNSVTITSPASHELIQTLTTVLATDSPNALLDYLASDSLGEVIERDARLDLFYQFAGSHYKGEIRPDWTDDNGMRYVCMTFHLAKRRTVDFCLPKNIGMQVALRDTGCPYDSSALTLNTYNKEDTKWN